jgi:hypothetical protein
MSETIGLPARESGAPAMRYTLRSRAPYALPSQPFTSRIAFAAAHVVARSCDEIDWDQTMAYRRHLWAHGFALAEAMDTSQRGMGLSWDDAQTLIRLSVAEAKSCGGKIFCGAGTDHLDLTQSAKYSLDDIVRAYAHQIEIVQRLGGRVILMASRALAASARSADDYAHVYERVLSHVDQPVIVHWLGEMFDPRLAGYWGSRDSSIAMNNCLDVLHVNQDKIDGIKISLLDAQREIDMRRKLPGKMRMYTGDDFNYPELILGDGEYYSEALLGIFDAIAPAAAAAFHALDVGDVTRYKEIFAPTVTLSRHIFKAPTYFYKTGITFLAWLNAHQEKFVMLDDQQTARSKAHFAELFVLADEAGVLRCPEQAAQRAREFFAEVD